MVTMERQRPMPRWRMVHARLAIVFSIIGLLVAVIMVASRPAALKACSTASGPVATVCCKLVR